VSTFGGLCEITINQASNIIEISKIAGGEKIGDYNVIIFQVEILNSLWGNGKITVEEGQNVIDYSKPKADWGDWGVRGFGDPSHMGWMGTIEEKEKQNEPIEQMEGWEGWIEPIEGMEEQTEQTEGIKSLRY
jgi:hypothetical protein